MTSTFELVSFCKYSLVHISMKFGLEKCSAMTMKRGKRVHSDGIALPDGTQLRALGEVECYKLSA